MRGLIACPTRRRRMTDPRLLQPKRTKVKPKEMVKWLEMEKDLAQARGEE
jgi:hypothetical protein